MKRFKNTKDFRENATSEDVQELYDYYKATKSSDWNKEEDSPYGFSRSSAINLLREKQMLGEMKKTKEKKEKKVYKINLKKLNAKKRTLYIADDLWEEIEILCELYEGANKQNIIDCILRNGLEVFRGDE